LSHKYTLFETPILLLETSAPHNCQIYHKLALGFDARDVKIIFLLQSLRMNPKHSEDFWSHIDLCTTQPYTEDYSISPHEDYRQDNILDVIY